jgi:hypothetical protein
VAAVEAVAQQALLQGIPAGVHIILRAVVAVVEE